MDTRSEHTHLEVALGFTTLSFREFSELLRSLRLFLALSLIDYFRNEAGYKSYCEPGKSMQGSSIYLTIADSYGTWLNRHRGNAEIRLGRPENAFEWYYDEPTFEAWLESSLHGQDIQIESI